MKIRSSLPGEERYIASVDLGSHTARLLLCRIVDSPEKIKPVLRKRLYTDLAKGFSQENAGIISRESINRALNALKEFSVISEKYNPEKILGAATGVFRRAVNSKELLNLIREKTGISVRIVSGEEEAAITLKGVVHALGLKEPPCVFFDLGGSTTEIVFENNNKTAVMSLPIGAFVLNDRYLRHDPPVSDEIEGLRENVYRLLSGSIGEWAADNPFIAGSGGTVTSLAALINDIDKKDLDPELINGVSLNSNQLLGIYDKLKPLSFRERSELKSIDEGRAMVILAGTIAVLTIMEYFKSRCLTVSYSDILEGLILSYLEGETYE